MLSDIYMKTKGKRSDFERINENAAGIDIGSAFHYVAVPEDRDEKSIKKFGCSNYIHMGCCRHHFSPIVLQEN